MAAYDRALYQAYLAAVPMFRSCTPEQLDRLASLGETVSATDSDIIREGDPGDAFFVVTSGKARVLRGGRSIAKSPISRPRLATRRSGRRVSL